MTTSKLKISQRLCEEAYLNLKSIIPDVMIPSVSLRFLYSGQIGIQLEPTYLPNAVYDVVNIAETLRDSTASQLLQTQTDGGLVSVTWRAMRLVLDNYATTLKTAQRSQLDAYVNHQANRITKLSEAILVLTLLEVLFFIGKIIAVLMIFKQVYAKFGSTIKVFGLIGADDAHQFVERCDMFMDKYITFKDRYKIDGEILSDLGEEDYMEGADDEPSEQDDPAKLQLQFTVLEDIQRSDEFYSRRLSDLEAIEQNASRGSIFPGNGINAIRSSFALPTHQSEAVSQVNNLQAPGLRNQVSNSVLIAGEPNNLVHSSSKILSTVQGRKVSNRRSGSQTTSKMKGSTSKDGYPTSNASPIGSSRKARQSSRASNIESVLKSLHEGIDDLAQPKAERIHSKTSLENRNFPGVSAQLEPAAILGRKQDPGLIPTSRNHVNNLYPLSTRDEDPILSMREHEQQHMLDAQDRQSSKRELEVVAPSHIKLTIPVVHPNKKKNPVQPKTLLSQRDEELQDKHQLSERISYQGKFLGEPLKRCASALAVWLPLCIYTLYRDLVNYQEYTRYKTHVLTTFRVQSDLKYLHTYTYLTISTGAYFNPDSLPSGFQAYTAATSSLADSIYQATSAQPGTLGGNSTHFSSSFAAYTSQTEAAFQRSLCGVSLVSANTPTVSGRMTSDNQSAHKTRT